MLAKVCQTRVRWNLNETAVIVQIVHDESRPFYGFGVDVEFKAIPAEEWSPFLKATQVSVTVVIAA